MSPLSHPARLLGSLAAAALLLAPATGQAARPRPVVDRGIVQAATATGLTLRELDGSVVTVPIDASTRILLNGRPAQIQDVQPGFVASTLRSDGRAARLVRAVGRVRRARPVRHAGTILSVSSAALVLGTPQGPVTATLGATTQVRLDGRAASHRDLRPGMRAALLQLQDGEARLIRAVSPRPPRRRRGARAR